jgi:hypothetical protein
MRGAAPDRRRDHHGVRRLPAGGSPAGARAAVRAPGWRASSAASDPESHRRRTAEAQRPDRPPARAAACAAHALGRPARRSSGSCRAATDLELRRRSAERRVRPHDLPGLRHRRRRRRRGPGRRSAARSVAVAAPLLPEDSKPRYLTGGRLRAGHRSAAVRAGVDMFDCVLPTRNGRKGWRLHPRRAPLRLRNACLALTIRPPIDPVLRLRGLRRGDSAAPASGTSSRATGCSARPLVEPAQPPALPAAYGGRPGHYRR